MRPASTPSPRPPSPRPHLSGEALDLLLIGAMPAAEANAAKVHLDACEPCRARWRELNEDKRRFEEHVFARTLPKVEAEIARSGGYPLAKRRRPATAWLAVLTTAVIAVIAAIVAVGALGFQRRGTAATLELSKTRPGGAPMLAPGSARLERGERLSAVVNPGRTHYLLLAERDEVGAVAVHFPPGGRSSGRLSTNERLEFEPAASLAPGTRTLVAIFSEVPVTIEQLEVALAQPPGIPGATVVTRSVVWGGDGAKDEVSE